MYYVFVCNDVMEKKKEKKRPPQSLVGRKLCTRVYGGFEALMKGEKKVSYRLQEIEERTMITP